MDTVRGFDDDRAAQDDTPGDATDAAVDDAAQGIGTDERRMHVRAYNHWVSLLGGRAYPSIENLDPASIADFGPHSVLLDFSKGIENPAIAYLGRALREECELDKSITHIAQVPSRSLLSRLTDHYLQIIANRAPIGFEAEFVGTRGHNTMYRGILMPFSSDEDTIDFIYGVINWKELVDAQTQAKLTAEVAASVRAAPRAIAPAPAWADGPSAGFDEPGDDAQVEEDSERDQRGAHEAPAKAASLSDQLALAQQTAASVRAADSRNRATLYRALGRAHEFALAAEADPEDYAALLDAAGISAQARAPMTPVVKLVFGADYDKTRLTEFATVLAYARRTAIAPGMLGTVLEEYEGGIKAIVKAERAMRRPAIAGRPDPATALRGYPALASVTLSTGRAAGEYVVLLARAGAGESLEIVAAINDTALTDRALRHAARRVPPATA